MRFTVFGQEIDYEVRGPEGARPLLLVHGLTTDRRILIEACEPALAEQPLRRVYVDLPGHGTSRGAVDAGSADHLVAALVGLLGEVGEPGVPPLLFGYAYGGYLCQGVARDVHSGGLFLACPVVEPDFGRRRLPPKRVVAKDDDLPFSSDERERPAFVEVAVRQTRPALEVFQRVVHPANIAANLEFVEAVRARYTMARPYVQALQQYTAPVTIVCGHDDHWVGFEDAVLLARVMPDVALHVLAGCGQLLPLEAGAAFRALLTEWLARCA